MSMMGTGACIAFQLVANAVSLDMQVGGADIRAVVDSGATVSVIGADLAAKLGLRPLDFSAKIHSDTGVSRAQLAGPVSVKIGGRSVLLPYVVVSSSYIALINRTGLDAQYVVGQDTLSGSVIDFNFSKKCVRFDAPSSVRTEHGYRALDLRRDSLGRYVVSIQIGELPETDAIVDLGNASPLMLSADFFTAAELGKGRPTSTAAIGMSSGIVTGKSITIPSATLAGFRMADIPVQIVPGWRSPQPVNIGLPLLQNFDVILDVPHAKVWFKALGRTHFDKDLSGLGIAYEGNYLRVVHVAVGSPAARSGWQVDERIIAVGGNRIDKNYFRSNAWRWRFNHPGRSITMTMADGSIRLIRLSSYF